MCDSCQQHRIPTLTEPLLCELCLKRGQPGKSCTARTQPQSQSPASGQGAAPGSSGAAKAAAGGVEGAGAGAAAGRKLRILCLHGFRQTAKQFEVRRA